MTYRLGVDLGTTFTAAAVANGGPPTMLGLGNRALQVPSVLYLSQDGDLVVGEAAERRGLTDPSRVVREFKRRIGDHVPMLVAGVPYSPQALTAQLLHWVVQAGIEQMGEPPASVVLTYPANWGPYKRELLNQVVQLADVGDVRTCSEPEAAAVQYAAKSRIQPGARIAMYDLGGGTFDTCVLEKRPDGFAMLGDPVGIEHLGGIDFDDAVFQHVLQSLGSRVSDLDPTDTEVKAGLARLRRDCVDAKEALSSDVHAVVPVTLPGLSTSVRLTRNELEELIRPPLEDTVAALGRAIRSAGVEPADLQAIVLVGGGSRIPLVRELLQQAFPVPTALDTHPKHDVALGAVQVGLEAPAVETRTDVATPATPDTEEVVPRPVPDSSAPEIETRPSGRFAQVRSSRVAVVCVAGALVLGAIAGLLTRGDDRPEPRPTAATAPTARSSTGSTTAVPSSAPLTDDQLAVPVKVDGNWEIFLADAQISTPVKRLVSDPAGDFSPALSPDRASIVFVHQEGSTRTLRVAAADGTGVRELFDPVPPQCASVFRPAWNPVDPTMLAVACISTSGESGLYLIRTDGRVLRELPVGRARVDDPAFSPDGRNVAYQAGPDSPFDGGSIYTIAVDGGSPKRITNVDAGIDADPAWSPDGERIAFRRRQPDGTTSGNFDVFVVPVDRSRSPRAIVTGEADDQDPTWSPDGEQLAIKSNRMTAGGKGAGPPRIWLTAADGSDLRLLWARGADGEQGAPAWSRR